MIIYMKNGRELRIRARCAICYQNHEPNMKLRKLGIMSNGKLNHHTKGQMSNIKHK